MEDVVKLPDLWRVYWQRLSSPWESRVKLESMSRVAVSQTTWYNPKGNGRAMGPSGWESAPRGYGFVRIAPDVAIIVPKVDGGEFEKPDEEASGPSEPGDKDISSGGCAPR